MVDFAAHTARIYARLGDSVSGPPGEFPGLVSSVDKDSFETASVGTHGLRYQEGVSLASGDVITVNEGEHAGDYKVIGLPRRLNGSEFSAVLVKQ